MQSTTNSLTAPAHVRTRGQAAPGVAGGGFGVGGAARGMALAAVANAAVGATHGLGDAIARGTDNASARRRKRALFEQPETRSLLADELAQVTAVGSLAAAELINARVQPPPFDLVLETDARRSAAIAENVLAGRVPEAEGAAALRDPIVLDPFAARPWRLWVDRFGDADGELAAAAAILALDTVAQAKRDALDVERGRLDWTVRRSVV